MTVTPEKGELRATSVSRRLTTYPTTLLTQALADKDDASRLMVRARRKTDLSNIFGANVEIIETPEADYRWPPSGDAPS